MKQALAANRWLRAQLVFLVVAAVYMPVAAVLSAVFGSAWVLTPVAVYFVGGAVCWVPSRRTERTLKVARVAAERKAAELRTPRVPDAGPGQCPVCGGFGLTELAKDDAFMARGADRAKVVAWGRKRAHRDCAEFVPYVPTKRDAQGADHNAGRHRPYPDDDRDCLLCIQETMRQERESRLGVYYRCRFCDDYQWAPSMEAAKVQLIVHSKECPERTQTATPFLWPDLKGWRK